MEEDIKILEELLNSKISFTLNPTDYGYTAIRNLINKNKELEKMVELMAFSLADYVMYYEYDKCRNPEMIKAKANEEIEYFKKKVRDDNG